ncbi:hypothetical protein ACFW5I_27430 [Streptomyces sp. NPDC058818]|uniref:hypothetical protein n=1 Tax=Streptomyces sp. NPDC058818 TaxID=3346640 RepID=UPI0036BB564D
MARPFRERATQRSAFRPALLLWPLLLGWTYDALCAGCMTGGPSRAALDMTPPAAAASGGAAFLVAAGLGLRVLGYLAPNA